MALKGFICYPRPDFEAIRRLEVHLTPVSLQYGIEFWWDRQLLGGDSWHPEIQRKISEADFFIAAITPDFFSSAYIQQTEWPAITARRQSSNALVLPIILRPCMWEAFLNSNGQLQAGPTHPTTHRVEPALSSGWHGEDGLFRSSVFVEQAVVGRFAPPSSWVGPQTDVGLKFVPDASDLTAKHGVIASVDSASDDAAARMEVVRQLHSSALELAKRLTEDIQNLGNQPTWGGFVESVRMLPKILGQAPSEFSESLGKGWSVLQSLAVAQAHDDDIARGKVSDAGPLGSARRVTLDELLAVYGSLLGCFPTVTQVLIPGLLVMQGEPISGDVVRFLAERVIDEGILDAESGRFLGVLVEASQGQGEAARRLTAFLEPTSRNLGFFIVAIAAAATGTPREKWSPLHSRSVNFAREYQAEIAAVNRGGIGVEVALNAVAQRLDSTRFQSSHSVVLPKGEIPNDVEERAVELLVSGSEVPTEWIPAIAKLDFRGSKIQDLSPLRTLSALKQLRLDGCPITELGPIAGLSALTTLSAAETGIVDIQELGKNSNIRVLNLSGTPIVDFAPLANLRVLQELRLSETDFTDVEVLENLTELRLLNVTATRLKSVDGFPPLSKLRKAWFSRSALSSCKGLHVLSGLRELFLDRTQLVKVDWEQGPAILRKIVLSNSPVADLSGLAGCPLLQQLEISHTNVTDLAPLSKLEKLESVKMYGTNITNMSSIALLPRLAELEIGNKKQAEQMLFSLMALPLEDRRWMRVARSFRGSSIVPSAQPYARPSRSKRARASEPTVQGRLFDREEK